MPRILLVEDHPSNRKLMGGILRRAGHEVVECETADAGIARALSEAFDLIVMDVQLPGTDGLTATRILRGHERTATLPILAVTAHAMAGDRARVLASGVDDYLSKPVSYHDLLKAVDALLTARGDASADLPPDRK